MILVPFDSINQWTPVLVLKLGKNCHVLKAMVLKDRRVAVCWEKRERTLQESAVKSVKESSDSCQGVACSLDFRKVVVSSTS